MDVVVDSSVSGAEAYSQQLDAQDDKSTVVEETGLDQNAGNSNLTESDIESNDNCERSKEFSTENFKIEIKNLPKYYGYGELKKMINGKLQLNARKIKLMPKGVDYTFVNFESEKDRNVALQRLNGFEWKKRKIEAIVAKPAQDPLLRKRRAKEDSTDDKTDVGVTKKQALEAIDLDVSTCIKNVVMPWWNIPYEDQVAKKTEEVNQVVKSITKEMCKVNQTFMITTRKSQNKFICDPDPLVCSPVKIEYRNKCEFTIGENQQTKVPTVGFRLSSYRGGSVSVGPVDDSLHHLPKLMVKSALIFQDYIQKSKYKPFDPLTHEGLWKQLTVRTTLNGQLMFLVVIYNNLGEEELKALKTDLTDYFKSHSELQITSFFFREQEKPGSKVRIVPELLFGEIGITEELLGLKFRISPEAFFQINTKATEVMYNTIQELADIDENTTVLDICCGTGTIGLCLASKCGQVLGVEIVPDAIDDAKYNAIVNNLNDKCQFYTAKAEDIVDILLTKVKCDKIVAVVDPPRGGVNQKVIQTLRRCERLTSIVFAFCDAKSAIKNFSDLGRTPSNAYKGSPFIPKKIVPVDLFPSTPHFELIVLFQRDASR